eukprot:TRINITY_DN5733_c0_g4_i1.p1 TRINITY_DN5733_c0_g4~~TRINITY_DN5733_c0_g4_i1.p1  ORF type:complete len:804 (+),score=117.38 TRINITY_DN5733_c0_g4_i1:196-2412(+)
MPPLPPPRDPAAALSPPHRHDAGAMEECRSESLYSCDMSAYSPNCSLRAGARRASLSAARAAVDALAAEGTPHHPGGAGREAAGAAGAMEACTEGNQSFAGASESPAPATRHAHYAAGAMEPVSPGLPRSPSIPVWQPGRRGGGGPEAGAMEPASPGEAMTSSCCSAAGRHSGWRPRRSVDPFSPRSDGPGAGGAWPRRAHADPAGAMEPVSPGTPAASVKDTPRRARSASGRRPPRRQLQTLADAVGAMEPCSPGWATPSHGGTPRYPPVPQGHRGRPAAPEAPGAMEPNSPSVVWTPSAKGTSRGGWAPQRHRHPEMGAMEPVSPGDVWTPSARGTPRRESARRNPRPGSRRPQNPGTDPLSPGGIGPPLRPAGWHRRAPSQGGPAEMAGAMEPVSPGVGGSMANTSVRGTPRRRGYAPPSPWSMPARGGALPAPGAMEPVSPSWARDSLGGSAALPPPPHRSRQIPPAPAGALIPAGAMEPVSPGVSAASPHYSPGPPALRHALPGRQRGYMWPGSPSDFPSAPSSRRRQRAASAGPRYSVGAMEPVSPGAPSDATGRLPHRSPWRTHAQRYAGAMEPVSPGAPSVTSAPSARLPRWSSWRQYAGGMEPASPAWASDSARSVDYSGVDLSRQVLGGSCHSPPREEAPIQTRRGVLAARSPPREDAGGRQAGGGTPRGGTRPPVAPRGARRSAAGEEQPAAVQPAPPPPLPATATRPAARAGGARRGGDRPAAPTE